MARSLHIFLLFTTRIFRTVTVSCSAGGYPELYAKELSANTSMRDAIRTAFRRGMPMVAECGGFMYLHSLLYPKMEAGSVAEGCAMAGVLDAECRYAGKLVRFGYIELEEVRGNFLPPYEKIKAHEFHYFDSSENGRACIATKPATGKNIRASSAESITGWDSHTCTIHRIPTLRNLL